MLLSIHIPKTAGTAWRLYLENNLGPRASYVSPEARDANEIAQQALTLMDEGRPDAARALIDASSCGLIAGHRARDFLETWPEAAAITWLRDPFERTVSEFLHFRSRPQPNNLAQKVARGELDIEAFAAQQHRYYSEIEARLKARPAAYCLFVDQFQDDALEACTRFAGWRGTIPRRNVTPRTQFAELGDEARLRDQLRPYLQEENAVYESWSAAWADGSALKAAQETLALAPERVAPGLTHQLRRKLGAAKEKLGHFLGRDWR